MDEGRKGGQEKREKILKVREGGREGIREG